MYHIHTVHIRGFSFTTSYQAGPAVPAGGELCPAAVLPLPGSLPGGLPRIRGLPGVLPRLLPGLLPGLPRL